MSAQISASISAATKAQLDAFARQHGLCKNHIVEQALLMFMASREEWPEEALIPWQLVLDDACFAEVVDAIDNPRPAPPALVALMRGER